MIASTERLEIFICWGTAEIAKPVQPCGGISSHHAQFRSDQGDSWNSSRANIGSAYVRFHHFAESRARWPTFAWGQKQPPTINHSSTAARLEAEEPRKSAHGGKRCLRNPTGRGGFFRNRNGVALFCGSARFGADVYLGNGFVAEDGVRLFSAVVDGNFSCDGGEFRNSGAEAITADGINVGRQSSIRTLPVRTIH